MTDVAKPESFLDFYLEYRKETEPPYNYARWCAIGAVAAILRRNFHIRFGDSNIYPNLYIMLVGESGSRKSTAIRGIKKVLTPTGYTTIAADKTTKEKFLLDLQGETEDLAATDSNTSRTGHRSAYDRTTAENLWGSEALTDTDPRCILIAADELIDFIGVSDIAFCAMLGQLWDYEGIYTSRIKNGRSVAVPDPTITTLLGTTAQNIALMFPPELIGQGWFSRLLMIYGEKSDRQYTIPPTPPPELTQKAVEFLKAIEQHCRGEATIANDAYTMLDTIYKGWTPINDIRFRNYSTRRFTQLLKLALTRAASCIRKQIIVPDVVYANTVLSAAERNMPKALGEFGKGRHSSVTDKIIRLLTGAVKPLGVKEFWKECHKDLDKPTDLAIIIQSLEQADKIFTARGLDGKAMGWLLKKEVRVEERFVDWKLLTEEERGLL